MQLAVTGRVLGVCAIIWFVGAAPRAAVAQEPTAAAASPVNTMAACINGASEGMAPGDAQTGSALVCDALRGAGANVATEPVLAAAASNGYGSAYRVDLRPLGALVILQVSYESPIGTRVQSRSMQLNGIEEVPVAAPRIADALMHNKPLATTAKVDTLVGEETRPYAKEYGETLVGFGIFGYALPNDTWAGYGAYGRLYYEGRRYAAGAEFRIGGSGASDGDSHLIGLGVGARYFLTDGDIAPFVGGGAGILWIGTSRNYHDAAPQSLYADNRTDIDGSGLAANAEVGVEFLRFHGSRLDALLRLDAPLFKLSGGDHDRYTMPISLMVSYSFD